MAEEVKGNVLIFSDVVNLVKRKRCFEDHRKLEDPVLNLGHENSVRFERLYLENQTIKSGKYQLREAVVYRWSSK